LGLANKDEVVVAIAASGDRRLRHDGCVRRAPGWA